MARESQGDSKTFPAMVLPKLDSQTAWMTVQNQFCFSLGLRQRSTAGIVSWSAHAQGAQPPFVCLGMANIRTFLYLREKPRERDATVPAAELSARSQDRAKVKAKRQKNTERTINVPFPFLRNVCQC